MPIAIQQSGPGRVTIGNISSDKLGHLKSILGKIMSILNWLLFLNMPETNLDDNG